MASFLFLSGYLTKIENDNWLKFYKKRIIRVIIPYVIWTIFYTVANLGISAFALKRILVNLVTTKASGPLYYVFVYIEFVLLTPLIGKLAKSKYRWIGWLISPLAVIVFKYYPVIGGFTLGKYVSIVWSACFLGWFTFYYLGILLGNKIMDKKYNIKLLVILYSISIILQMMEGYVWLRLGVDNCGGQLKFTAFVTSTLFLLMSYWFIVNDKVKIKSKLLVLIGNYSFGIYLSHMMVIKYLRKVPFYSSIPYIANSFIVLSLCLIVLIIGHKICGKKVSEWLGII